MSLKPDRGKELKNVHEERSGLQPGTKARHRRAVSQRSQSNDTRNTTFFDFIRGKPFTKIYETLGSRLLSDGNKSSPPPPRRCATVGLLVDFFMPAAEPGGSCIHDNDR
jgi:hypothetical protein